MKRVDTLLAPTDIGTAGTYIIDINTRDQISALDVIFRAVNVTVSVMLNWVLACISKIEIVDGSDVKLSVSGAEAFALDYLTTGKLPYTEASLTVGGYFGFGARIHFGRMLWDHAFALRPDLMKNPQLRITWDEDACNTGAIVNTLEVYAHVDDAPPQGGAAAFLLTKQVKSYALAGAAHEYSDLPTDAPIRLMLIDAYSNDHDTEDLVDTIKIGMNNNSKILVDQSIRSIINASDRLGIESYPWTPDKVVTAKTFYSVFGSRNSVNLQYDATAHVTAQTKFALNAPTGPLNALSASVDIQADFADVSGRVPGCCVPIFFGDPKLEDSWLGVNPNDSLRADILGLAASDSGDTLALVTQQAKRY